MVATALITQGLHTLGMHSGHVFDTDVRLAITVKSSQCLLNSSAALAFDVNWGSFMCFKPKEGDAATVA